MRGIMGLCPRGKVGGWRQAAKVILYTACCLGIDNGGDYGIEQQLRNAIFIIFFRVNKQFIEVGENYGLTQYWPTLLRKFPTCVLKGPTEAYYKAGFIKEVCIKQLFYLQLLYEYLLNNPL
jgi:hypothetical protein